MRVMKKGDYVIYQNGPRAELGRVLSMVDERTARVCFHGGCTSAATDVSLLTPLCNSYVIESTSLGHHVFDKTCPDRVDAVCGKCPAKKG